MQVWPAIDIRAGKCVRLTRGDFGQETVYGDPIDMARRWVSEGAGHLHIVDLDGARDGAPVNHDVILQIIDHVEAVLQVGGGCRDLAAISHYLDAGINRVIVGTAAIADERSFRSICDRFPQRIVLGIDSRDGKVATNGWLNTSSVKATELAERFNDLPLAAIVYTDISVDGTMSGPNLPAMSQMMATAASPLIASGGVRDRSHVEALAGLGLSGVILGRSLYEKTLSLADALAGAKTVQASLD